VSAETFLNGAKRVERPCKGVTLYLGDCLEVLPNVAADVKHIITDPPYEDELHNAMGSIRRNDGREMIDDLEFEGINASRDEVAAALVAASSGWLIIFTLAEGVRAWRDPMQAAGAKWDTTLAWIKPDSMPRFNGQGAARGFECAVTAWCGPGYRKWNGGGKRGIYTHLVNFQRQGEHPTEKPLPLMCDLVADFTQPGELICDPFLGSGTTAIAALRAGRPFIGIEKKEKWFDLALARVQASFMGKGEGSRHIARQLGKHLVPFEPGSLFAEIEN
jgi:site-specific DNA-methyltransferase (adenine-specific)